MPKPQRIRLTADRVADLKHPGDTVHPVYWYDDKQPQLAVRVTANGAKAYVFRGKLGSMALRITIGNPAAWAPADARVEAIRLQTLVDGGIDPRTEKTEKIAKAEKDNQRNQLARITLGEVWDQYIEDRLAKWSEAHRYNHRILTQLGGEPRTRGRRPGEPKVTQPGPLRPLMTKRLADVNAAAVAAWLRPLAARAPAYAALAFRSLRAFIRWCSEHDVYKSITHADACELKRVTELVPAGRARKGALQKEQLSPWFAAVRQGRSPIPAAFLQILLLTGARCEELLQVRWTDVDFTWKTMTIGDKEEGERTIPLTPYIEALLRNLPRINDRRGEPLPWVFASPRAANGRMQDVGAAHAKALRLAGLPRLTQHDLRRSFKTLSEWVEMPVGIVAQIMGHKPSATAEKHYTARPIDLLRLWHTKYEAWLLEQAGIEAMASTPALRLVS